MSDGDGSVNRITGKMVRAFLLKLGGKVLEWPEDP
jgi:hypothetical protein